ncbi:glycosyl transferases group 1 [Ferrovum myxofaciens]|uniref:Glycosyl transferases group 1 n=1 Tax=Ferrovum myxofaciens TaxID=416213 RepID=A0A149VXC4_9PROT|nr:glycosyltransferase family 1 protein [Ferrovum myxofaciens]KXW57867.1 glycosyl transferases group 1 [Ferrovum myxofaciens]
MLIDVTRLLDRQLKGRLPTGVDRVGLEYVRHYGDHAQALVRFGGRWVELNRSDSRRLFSALLTPTENFRHWVYRCLGHSYAWRWPRWGKQNRWLFNTGHSGLDDREYARRIQRSGLRPIFFLHDLIPLTHPEYCRPGSAAKHHQRLETMLHLGHGLILNSQDTHTFLASYAANHHWTVPPHVVAHLAPPPFPPPSPDRPLEDPYFVVLGTLEARKNHLLLLNLWREWGASGEKNIPRLVLIGQRVWECEQVVDMLERCEAVQPHVLEVSRCSDGDLATWLYHAQALLFPSFVEGFGMPLVEALSLRVPVIASDLPVFREIAGDCPVYLHPLDGLGWKRALLSFLDSSSVERQSQCQRLHTCRIQTWTDHFAQVDALLERL